MVFIGVCLSVCLFVCLFIRAISQKLLQLGSPNLTQRSSTMSHWKPIHFGSKGQGHSAGVGFCTFVSSGFFSFLPVNRLTY